MRKTIPNSAAVMAIIIALAVQTGLSAVKVRAEFDKTFDFRNIRRWGWNPRGAGTVVLARTPDEDREVVRRRVEPVILSAVATEMPRRGLELAADAPELTLNYFLLLTVGMSAQTRGQFLPTIAHWGLPPFAPSTTSLEVIEQGSLVLDLSAKGEVVWRGIAEAEIKMELDNERRAALIREAVRKILEKYPPKK